MYIKTLSVTDLNNYIKKIIDTDYILNNTNIKGEISNFKVHSSGHIYFSLKDEFSKINCIMFGSFTESLSFMPENGMKVIAKGRISVYQKDGIYQLYCEELRPEGIGELYLAYQKLKDKLQDEGMFDVKYKKPLPKYPRRVGIITSKTGAAVRDIINVAMRRNNKVSLLIYPSLVQGANASEEIIKGIDYFNNVPDVDVIILARGGGSIEELWAFNNEKLAYSIFHSSKPIVSGIGHETDFTIADFVSDRRAPTPSAAAEIVVENLSDINNRILNFKDSLSKQIKNKLMSEQNKIKLLNNSLNLYSPANIIINEYNHIDKLKDRLRYNFMSRISTEKEKLSRVSSLITAHNPLNILNKGYSVIQDDKNRIISELDKLKKSNEINVTLKDGKAKFKIEFKGNED